MPEKELTQVLPFLSIAVFFSYGIYSFKQHDKDQKITRKKFCDVTVSYVLLFVGLVLII